MKKMSVSFTSGTVLQKSKHLLTKNWYELRRSDERKNRKRPSVLSGKESKPKKRKDVLMRSPNVSSAERRLIGHTFSPLRPRNVKIPSMPREKQKNRRSRKGLPPSKQSALLKRLPSMPNPLTRSLMMQRRVTL